MSETWLTSDLHINHPKAVLFREGRYESLHEMNEALIEEFNEVVRPEDTVYCLGDMCLGDADEAPRMMKRLNGKKILVIGNHDTDAKVRNYAAENVFVDMTWQERLKVGSRFFYLNHYQMVVKNFTKDPIWCLHGHTHAATALSEFHNNFHVGIDAWDTPISIDAVRYLIKAHEKQKVEDVDGDGILTHTPGIFSTKIG